MKILDLFKWRTSAKAETSTAVASGEGAPLEKRSTDWDGVSTPPPAWLVHLTGNKAKVAVTETNVMGIPAYFGAVRLVSEQIASLPFGIFQKIDRLILEVTDHPCVPALERPSVMMDRFQFIEQLIQNTFIRGNAYIIQYRRGGDTYRLKLISKNEKPDIYEVRGKTWYKFPSLTDAVKAEDVIHIRTFSKDGEFGVNPLALFKETFATAISQTDYVSSFFGNGAHLSAVLETDKVVTPTQEESILTSFNTKNAGMGNVGKVAMLQAGLKYKPISVSPKETEFIPVRRANIADVSNITGVPVPLLADLERATFSNIENLNQQFVDYTLRIWCKRIETQFNHKLFYNDPPNLYFVRFNLNALVRGDMVARTAYYVAARQNGWMSANDVRELENMNPVDGLDEYGHPLMDNNQQNNNADGNGNN